MKNDSTPFRILVLNSSKHFLNKFQFIKSLALRVYLHPVIRIKQLKRLARLKNIQIKDKHDYLDFFEKDSKNVIRINKKHIAYASDIINSFEYYFKAVQPIKLNELDLVDYSTPRYHEVVGYDRHPIFFQSFAEPLTTTYQYLEFADLKQNAVVLDLGAYSGLTSIVFKEIVGPNGTVVAIEADDQNFLAINKNINIYEKTTGNKIHTINGAVWSHNDGLEFSVEGNMGSSAASIVGHRDIIKKVPSFTLSAIAAKFNLENIDFIKCDIEGAEAVIFEDGLFFKTFKPRIIVEVHFVKNKETTDKVMSDLKKYGYTFKKIHQTGVTLPLLECYPPISKI